MPTRRTFIRLLSAMGGGFWLKPSKVEAPEAILLPHRVPEASAVIAGQRSFVAEYIESTDSLKVRLVTHFEDGSELHGAWEVFPYGTGESDWLVA